MTDTVSNQANVDALHRVLEDLRQPSYDRPITGEAATLSQFLSGDVEALHLLASALAEQGVLVPSALTDDDCDRAALDLETSRLLDEIHLHDSDDMRAELERIAKGEP